ncbi:hypothetical protein EVAR_35911_1 [Eumeta japonica]|uniref:Helitron helicase-like domain-containing protein n=1 Tax=Eumeta variegata TaxID=151549 RepID=A0A4C1WWV2_EUMVA|nr:hypothetical protein EVAR_35911_1 [Eumeta japonica]
MYSVEWQKRGFPHIHIIIWLFEKIRPNEVDKIITAKTPHVQVDPGLQEVVIKNIIHGPCVPHGPLISPCGTLNPNSPDVADGKCSKRYPRVLIPETIAENDGYPPYRRRSTADNGRSTLVKVNQQYIEIDLDMEDVNISLEDLQNIDLLEANYLSETRIALIENQSQSNSDSEYEIHNPTKRRRRVIASDSESETDSVTNFIAENVASIKQTSHTYQKWSQPRGYQPSVIAFTEPTGMKEPYARKLKHAAEGDYFKLMVSDDLFEKIAAETNLFAE